MLIPQKKYLYYICIAECKSWPENNFLQTCFKTVNVCWTNVSGQVHPAKVQKQIMITENQYSKLGAYPQMSMRMVLT